MHPRTANDKTSALLPIRISTAGLLFCYENVFCSEFVHLSPVLLDSLPPEWRMGSSHVIRNVYSEMRVLILKSGKLKAK